jgi:hypothetical protein
MKCIYSIGIKKSWVLSGESKLWHNFCDANGKCANCLTVNQREREREREK